MLNQKEGVFTTITAIVGDFDQSQALELTKDQRAEVIDQVTEGLLSETIQMTAEARAKHDTAEKMRTYANGLVSNWLRKDPRLNGGVKYEAKNPGSRAGSGDKVVRELKKLQKTFASGSAEYDAIQEEIDKRVAKIQAEKAKNVEIDSNLIPAELRHLVNY